MIRRLLRVVSVALSGLVVAAGMTATVPRTASAMPMERDPLDESPWVNQPVFTPPAGGFQWSVPNRFGATESGPGARTGIVDYHWNSDQRGNQHVGPMYTYDPTYVHPTTLTATFDGCPTAAEEDASATSTTQYTYSWALRDPASGDLLPGTGNPTAPAHACRWSHDFPIDLASGVGQTTKVGLTVTDPAHNNNQIGSYQQDVTVRDLLIVSIGDSYASGEGNPDIPRGDADEGQWVDVRCHRSVAAAAAQAALTLERADPHTSVTFLSFACSGATINLVTAANESPLDPYAPPVVDADHPAQPNGTGLLGPYRGVAPRSFVGFDTSDVGYAADADFLPDQITQVTDAVRTYGYSGTGRDAARTLGTPRKIDALVASGGGNDMGFARVATVCVLVQQCRGRTVTAPDGNTPEPLDQRVSQDVAALDGRYDALAHTIDDSGLDISKVLVTEYPDPARDDTGAVCGSILYDVLPAWLQVVGSILVAVIAGALVTFFPVLAPLFAAGAAAVIAGGVFPPFNMTNDPVFGEEVGWAASSISPALSAATSGAATRHAGDRVPWRFIDHIADRYRSANGAGHGYCASPANSWIRTATDSTTLEGPPGLINNNTKGTLHPTAAGLKDTGDLIFNQQLSGLVSAPSSSPPAYSVDYGHTVTGADGWLTGCSGTGCVGGSPMVTVSAQDSDGILAAGLRVDGVSRTCAGETVAGVVCSATSGADTYGWGLRFTTSGAHHLSFDVTSQRDERKTLDLDVKVDRENPTVADASVPAAPASGWYRTPVDVTVDGADAAGGSRLQGVQYKLDGGTAQLAAASSLLTAGMPASAAQVHVAGDGNHTVEYWAVDGAGRTSAHKSVSLRIDGTPPSVGCGSADGVWHAADVSVPCTATDPTSGLANPTDDAGFSLATGVVDGNETADAPTASRTVCDVAGNCATAGPVGHNMVDKKAPTITITAPTGAYVYGQSVAADYACADGGSGLASCVGTVANGAAVDTGSVGQKSFTVDAADALAHPSTQTAQYQVNKAATVTTVTADVNPSVVGQAVTFTARVGAVAPGAGTPTGFVQFKDGTTALGGALTLTDGVATLTWSSLAVGPHTVTAVYGGDENFLNGVSAAHNQVVNRAATTTTLSSDANPSVFGQPVTFTATVAAAPPGAGVPGGTVQFRNGSGDLGPPVALVNGVATFRAGLLSGGPHTLSAVYSGDGSFLDSTATLAQQVTAAHVVSGNVDGVLTLTAGSWFLDGAVVTSDVRVQRGAAVAIRNSRLGGSLTASGAAAMAVCGSDVAGTATVSATSGFVLLGDPGDDDCAGNVFRGAAVVKGNRGGVEIGANSFRGGLTVSANTGNGPLPEDRGTEIEANQVSGKLACSSNSPPPTNDGHPNTAGTRSGQCSSPSF